MPVSSILGLLNLTSFDGFLLNLATEGADKVAAEIKTKVTNTTELTDIAEGFQVLGAALTEVSTQLSAASAEAGAAAGTAPAQKAAS